MRPSRRAVAAVVAPLLLAVACALVGACASSSRRASASASTAPPDAAEGPDAAAGAADAEPSVPVPSVADLAARADRDAPGMRERLRLDPAPPRSPDLVADADADTCLRVAFAASRPVRVQLTDARGAARGEPAQGTLGLVPPLGPACAVRGSALHLVVEPSAEGTLTRAVVLAAP